MNRQPWWPEHDEIMRRCYPHNTTAKVAEVLGRTERAVYMRADTLGLKKSPEYFATENSGRIQRGKQHPAMIASQFKPGQVPPNKGLRRPGWAPGRMATTQFKKGAMAGAAQHNYVPVGSTRISKDGYLERKVTDDHPVPARRWVAVHRLAWEAVNGPVPEGHAVVFLPGRHSQVAEEITADAVECISRADLMRRNTLWNRYPPEVAQVMQLRGALNRKIRNRSKTA